MCRKIKKKSHLLDFTVPFLSFFFLFFVGRRETTWFLSIFLLVDCIFFMNKNCMLPQWVRRWVLTGRSGFWPLPPPLSIICESVVSLHVWVPFSSHVWVCVLLVCVSPLLLTCVSPLLLTCVSLCPPRLCKSLKGPSPIAGIPKKCFMNKRNTVERVKWRGAWRKGLPDVEIDLFFNTQSDFGV